MCHSISFLEVYLNAPPKGSILKRLKILYCRQSCAGKLIADANTVQRVRLDKGPLWCNFGKGIKGMKSTARTYDVEYAHYTIPFHLNARGFSCQGYECATVDLNSQ